MSIRAYRGMEPDISPDAWIADTATVVGDVSIEAGASVWYGAVVRGDSGPIRIGANTAVEDNATIHGAVELGADVIIGHNAIVHGCTVGDGALIGMGACVLDGAHIGAGALVAADALVSQGTEVPAESLAIGVPARVKGPLTDAQRASFADYPDRYREFADGQLERFGS